MFYSSYFSSELDSRNCVDLTVVDAVTLDDVCADEGVSDDVVIGALLNVLSEEFSRLLLSEF